MFTEFHFRLVDAPDLAALVGSSGRARVVFRGAAYEQSRSTNTWYFLRQGFIGADVPISCSWPLQYVRMAWPKLTSPAKNGRYVSEDRRLTARVGTSVADCRPSNEPPTSQYLDITAPTLHEARLFYMAILRGEIRPA
jgi:hypothetical protein